MSTYISPGWALAHAHGANRNCNPERAMAWERVLQDMLSKDLHVGSRTPTGDPAWVTPRVLEGGFAVPGDRLAGGPLCDHELVLLQQLQGAGQAKHDAAGVLPRAQELMQNAREDISEDVAARVRATLNNWSMGAEGMSFWLERLSSGCLRVCQAEEGAGLAVALLIQADKVQAAQEVVQEIAPWFGTLRFFPRLADTPVPEGDMLSRFSVAQLHESLKHVCEPTPRILVQMWAMEHRWPLYDELAEMTQTTAGARPGSWLEAEAGSGGNAARAHVKEQLLRFKAKEATALAKGKAAASGPKGVELRQPRLYRKRNASVEMERQFQQVYGGNKSMRSSKLGASPQRQREAEGDAPVQEDDALLAVEPVDGFLPRCMRKDGYSVLRKGLERYALGRDTPKDRERVAAVMSKREETAKRRHEEKAHLPKCYKFAMARDVVMMRLEALAPDAGIPLEKLHQVLAPLSERELEEVGKHKGYVASLGPGEAVPPSLAEKCETAKCAPLEQLVEEGIVPSAEVLAGVVKPLVASVRTVDIQQPLPRRLAQMLIQAFANRRSLLLLDMQVQVTIKELPWYAALRTHFADQQLEGQANKQQQRQASTQQEGQADMQQDGQVGMRLAEQAGPAGVDAFDQTMSASRLLYGDDEQDDDASGLGSCLPAAEQLVRMSVKYFGGQTLPNELISQLQPLLPGVPLVKMVAADIFMNEFHPKYVTQAKALADPRTGVAGTMYERYYDLGSSFAKLQSLQDLDEAGAQLARREFYTLCEQRAQEALGAPVTSYTIENGATIEQAALLTSHNYHMLLRTLGLDKDVGLMLAGMDACLKCLKGLLKRGGPGDSDSTKTKQHIALDAASALRNLLLFASFLEKAGHSDVVLQRLQAFLDKHAAASAPSAQAGLLMLEAARFDAAAAAARVQVLEQQGQSGQASTASKLKHAEAQAQALRTAAAAVGQGAFAKLTPAGLHMQRRGPLQAVLHTVTSMQRSTGRLVRGSVWGRREGAARVGAGLGTCAGSLGAANTLGAAGAAAGTGSPATKREDVRVFPGLVVVVAGVLAAARGMQGGLAMPLMGYTLEDPHWIMKCIQATG